MPVGGERTRADGRIALLAKDDGGYANLMRLSTNAYFAAAETGEVVTHIADLAAHAEGLIALTGGPEGIIDLALAEGNPELARSRLESAEGDVRRQALCRAATSRPAA